MRSRDRLRHWLADRILGDHSADPWDCCDCNYGPPDYYERGLAVYDVNKRVTQLDPDTTSFKAMLDRLSQNTAGGRP